mmetsp:Transcript_3801/g.10766  ORF Transcript_3801/g.10766 Transcript_3801/m.10766 type:complete len:263 (-) Transcript_3801:655-1443(-)
MSLRLALHSLQRLDALLLGVDREVVRPLEGALMRLRERLIFILEEGLHLHLFSRLSAGFALIFLLLLGLLNSDFFDDRLRAMQVALDLLQLRGLLATVLGVRIWLLRGLLVEINLLLLYHFVPGRHAGPEHVTRRERAPLFLFRRLLRGLLGRGGVFSGLFLGFEAVSGRPLLRVLLGALEALLFFLGELLLQLLFFRDVGAPGLPHALSTAEGVAEVGAVLLALLRRETSQQLESRGPRAPVPQVRGTHLAREHLALEIRQ